MSPVLLELPNDVADWPVWLERQLVGLRLAEFVDELELISGAKGAGPALDEVLDRQAPQVLARGLSVLSEVQTRTLLQHPRLLLDLQERVLIDGGDYWRTVERSADHDRQVADAWPQLAAELNSPAPQATVSAQGPGQGGASPRSSRRQAVWVTLAAALLIAATAWRLRPEPAPTGWGWDRSGALAVALPPDQYLNHLADSANEWFNKRPESADALAQRLREFRQGCDALIAAPHTTLAKADRDWLVERCRAWSGKLDGHLADLSTGAKPLEQVRSEADETVRKLMQAIRDRAGTAVAA